ncbi:MAG TPA: hypothetical protein PJ982_18090 [Lacipirellulaceae bacterium]|nr:hypothetical protein [Lacipirellulaceae bacterium]
MKCRGLSVTAAALPPSLPVALCEFFPSVVVHYIDDLNGGLLYQAPWLPIATPPPEPSAA